MSLIKSSIEPSPTWINDFRKVALAMNRGDQNIRIPFVSATLPDIKSKDYIDLLKSIKEGAVPRLIVELEASGRELRAGEDYEEFPVDAAPGGVSRTPYVDAIKKAKANIKAGLAPVKEKTAINFPIAEVAIGPNVASLPAYAKSRGKQPKESSLPAFVKSRGKQPKGNYTSAELDFSSYSKKELKSLAKARGLTQTGNIAELIAKLSE